MTSIRWLGHAAFEMNAENRSIFVDPFLTGNPLAPIKASEVSNADIVCVTHDHHDHLGDAIDICKHAGATFLGIAELAGYAESEGVRDVVGMNIGGTAEVKGVKISMVQAFHSASRGSPVGFVIELEGDKIYHAGDTSLFGDMKLIGQIFKPKVACLPIGGYYTAGPREAAMATSLIKPKIVVPMHYNTFPVIRQDPNEFARFVEELAQGVSVKIMEIGERFHIP